MEVWEMGLAKRTYSLPAQVLAEFEREVAAGRRSLTIARLMCEHVASLRRGRLCDEVVQGCCEMAAEYLTVEHEMHHLEEEVEHALAEPAAPRRRRARQA